MNELDNQNKYGKLAEQLYDYYQVYKQPNQSLIERLKVSLNPLLENDLIVSSITPQTRPRFNRSPLI